MLLLTGNQAIQCCPVRPYQFPDLRPDGIVKVSSDDGTATTEEASLDSMDPLGEEAFFSGESMNDEMASNVNKNDGNTVSFGDTMTGLALNLPVMKRRTFAKPYRNKRKTPYVEEGGH